MDMVRLYIADMDERFVSQVRGVATQRKDLEIIGNAKNGRQALNEIMRLTPDVVLLDIPLPELDGIALLRELQRLRRPPAAIVCTGFCSDACMRCASRYGAAFFLCKPVDLNALPGLILECGRDAQALSPESRAPAGESAEQRLRAGIARELLKELGLSARLTGSACVIEAVTRCHGNDMLFRNLSRGLYAELAARMDTSVPRVERALRSAIGIAYDRGTLGRHFPRRPTNRQFMEFVMRHVDESLRDRGGGLG